MNPIRVSNCFSTLAFAPLAVVQPTEGLVFGDVGIEEFERVLRDDAIRDHFVVSDDVDKRQSVEAVFGVGLHGVELHFSCWTGSVSDAARFRHRCQADKSSPVSAALHSPSVG